MNPSSSNPKIPKEVLQKATKQTDCRQCVGQRGIFAESGFSATDLHLPSESVCFLDSPVRKQNERHGIGTSYILVSNPDRFV